MNKYLTLYLAPLREITERKEPQFCAHVAYACMGMRLCACVSNTAASPVALFPESVTSSPKKILLPQADSDSFSSVLFYISARNRY